MRKATPGVLLAILLLGVSTVRALTVEDYLKDKEGQTTRAYIRGMGNAFEWANAELEVRHQPPLFCQPGKLGLDTYNYLQILDQTIEDLTKDIKGNSPGDQREYLKWLHKADVDYFLLQGLVKTFPCPPSQNPRPW